MTANINEHELALLAYLHEHATGYGTHHRFNADVVRQSMAVTKEEFSRYLSYLWEHGLADAKVVDTSTMSGPSHVIPYVWITGIGEDYMRELEKRLDEKEPGNAKKVTVTVVKEGWGVIRTIATSVLTDFAKHLMHMPH